MDKHLLDGRPFRPKEVSWLSFNSRVLEEAEDPTVPLMERMRFLGIYSSNLDEFFRVRVATLRRLARLGKAFSALNIPDPAETLFEVHEILVRETAEFNKAYENVLEKLEGKGIFVVDELSLPLAQREHLMEYFLSEVRPHLMPILLKGSSDLSNLRDHPMYLAVEMKKKSGAGRPAYALIEIPSDILPRFYVLPENKELKSKDGIKQRQVIYLDDIIRFGLSTVFESLPYDSFDAYAIKFTRDSELEFDDDFTESIMERMSEGLRARLMGSPVRMNYDAKMPEAFLRLLRKKLNFSQLDSLYPGARYHNRKSLMGFPTLGRKHLCWPSEKIVPHPQLDTGGKKIGFFKCLQKQDVLLHLPYHSFGHFLDFLRESAMDPLVKAISLTQYRFARNSCVAAALVAAVRNGKRVTVMVEPQARFDEEANLAWAANYREAGIRVIMGLPGLKVHAKLCLVERTEGRRKRSVLCHRDWQLQRVDREALHRPPAIDCRSRDREGCRALFPLPRFAGARAEANQAGRVPVRSAQADRGLDPARDRAGRERGEGRGLPQVEQSCRSTDGGASRSGGRRWCEGSTDRARHVFCGRRPEGEEELEGDRDRRPLPRALEDFRVRKWWQASVLPIVRRSPAAQFGLEVRGGLPGR